MLIVVIIYVCFISFSPSLFMCHLLHLDLCFIVLPLLFFIFFYRLRLCLHLRLHLHLHLLSLIILFLFVFLFFFVSVLFFGLNFAFLRSFSTYFLCFFLNCYFLPNVQKKNHLQFFCSSLTSSFSSFKCVFIFVFFSFFFQFFLFQFFSLFFFTVLISRFLFVSLF